MTEQLTGIDVYIVKRMYDFNRRERRRLTKKFKGWAKLQIYQYLKYEEQKTKLLGINKASTATP